MSWYCIIVVWVHKDELRLTCAGSSCIPSPYISPARYMNTNDKSLVSASSRLEMSTERNDSIRFLRKKRFHQVLGGLLIVRRWTLMALRHEVPEQHVCGLFDLVVCHCHILPVSHKRSHKCGSSSAEKQQVWEFRRNPILKAPMLIGGPPLMAHWKGHQPEQHLVLLPLVTKSLLLRAGNILSPMLANDPDGACLSHCDCSVYMAQADNQGGK